MTPVISGVVQDSADAPVSGEFFLLTSQGTPVGGTPTATGEVASGERISYQVPDDVLTDGKSYKWFLEACYQGTCSSPTPTQAFTVDTSAAPAPSAGSKSVTISGSAVTDFDAITDPGACSGSDCPATSNGTLKVGGDGTSHWASALDFNLAAIPANAVVTGATLDLTQSACLGNCGSREDTDPVPGSCPLTSLGCPPWWIWTGTLDIYPADSPVSSVASGTDLTSAADPAVIASGSGNAGSYDVTPAVQTWFANGMPNDGLVLEAAGNATALSGAGYYSSRASEPAADLPRLVVHYAPPAPPSAPTGLSVTPGDGGAEVRWDAPTGQGDDQGITGYTVEAVASSGAVAASASPDGSSAVLTGLTNGQAYTVSVAATNAEGSGPAATATATPVAVAGSAADVTAVQQFLNGQMSLQDGASPTASAAVAGDSEAGMISAQLTAEQATDVGLFTTQQAAGVTETDPASTFSDTLVTPAGDGSVQVFATDDQTFNTVTATGTSSQDSTASEQVTDYLFTISTGSSAQITGYVDADAATYQATGAGNMTATSTSLDDDSDTSLPAGYVAPAPATQETGPAASPDTSVNLSGTASWAIAHYRGTNNGYRDDCTDFVSRALHFGGGDPENWGWDAPVNHKDDHYWYRGQIYVGWTVASYSWAGAHNLAVHFRLNGSYFLDSWRNARKGDIIFANWSNGKFSGISHAGIISKVSNGIPLIAQHTHDHKYESIYHWFEQGTNVHVWVVVPKTR